MINIFGEEEFTTSNDWSRYIDLREEGKASADDHPIAPNPIKLP